MTLGARLARLGAQTWVKRAAGILRWALMALVFGLLVWRVSEIGWRETLRALPGNPLFYLLFLCNYLTLPLCEMLIYRGLWALRWRELPVFLQKRILNDTLIDYSGDGYLSLWAQRKTGRRLSETAHTVKDVSIVSGLVGNATTLALLLWLLAGGRLHLLLETNPGLAPYLLIPAGIILVAVVILLVFGRTVFRLSRRQGLRALLGHGLRQGLTILFLVGQWAVALPQTPWATWFVFLAARMALSRVPFLPQKELAYAALGVGMAGLVNAEPAQVAAMFLVQTVLIMGLNMLIFIIIQLNPSYRRQIRL